MDGKPNANVTIISLQGIECGVQACLICLAGANAPLKVAKSVDKETISIPSTAP